MPSLSTSAVPPNWGVPLVYAVNASLLLTRSGASLLSQSYVTGPHNPTPLAFAANRSPELPRTCAMHVPSRPIPLCHVADRRSGHSCNKPWLVTTIVTEKLMRAVAVSPSEWNRKPPRNCLPTEAQTRPVRLFGRVRSSTAIGVSSVCTTLTFKINCFKHW